MPTTSDDLAETLRWYAEQARLCRLIHSEGDAGRNALAADGGAKAREALARASLAPSPAAGGAPLPEGIVLAPHYRGYAHLGTGNYLIDHTQPGDAPEVVISIATEADKAGRSVGEDRDNPPGKQIQPDDIAVRVRFESAAGLDALEKQLRYLREVHFADSINPDSEPIGEVVIGEDGTVKGWTVVRWRKDLPPIAVGTKLYAAPPAPSQPAATDAPQPEPAPNALRQLTAALQADPDYAWSWHCNLAMPVMDATGVTHRVANEAGARLMRHLFDIDITNHPHWNVCADPAPAPQPEPVNAQTLEALKGVAEEAQPTPAPLRRGVNGVCSRSYCICERDGLGDQCVWLNPNDAELERRTGEPHISGWPLYSGLPPPAALSQPAPAQAVPLTDVERCPCGYPQPCALTVPIGFCRSADTDGAKHG